MRFKGRAALIEHVTGDIADGLIAWADESRDERDWSRYPIPSWADSREIAEQIVDRHIAPLIQKGSDAH